MTSTTANKKNIVDFLWEWAEAHGAWSKLLISKIVGSESNLSSEDRENIFNYFLQSISLYTGLPNLDIIKPIYTPTNKNIELVSLSDITGVNKLAKNQTITFGKNLTVIFGENGTGKTGYGRILKSLGFSYDANNKILSNIFGIKEARTATIKFRANGVDETFSWDGTNKNPELENISVFNNNCVQISLSDRQLIVSPIGFHLFNLVTAELGELTKLFAVKIALHPISISWIGSLNLDTPQQVYISGLNSKSTEQRLTELSTYTSENEKELESKETELSNLNKTLLQTEIKNLNTAVIELSDLIGKVETAQTNFSMKIWQTLLDLKKQIIELESNTQTSIKDLAEKNGIEFYETVQFQSFIKAAEDYIKIIDKPSYPNDKDICIYCLQPLEKSAAELLMNYRNLLNDKSQENLLLINKQKTDIINQVLKIDTNLTFHQPIFGIDEKERTIQPAEILEYNKNLETLKTIFTTDNVAENSTFNFDYSKYINFLTEEKTTMLSDFTKKQNTLSNLSVKESDLKKNIAELKDRKLLSTKTEDIKILIKNNKIVSVLNKNAGNFNSTAISKKTTQARDELVSSNFDTIFRNELKAFRKTHINVDLNFGTDKGNSKVSQRINTHLLIDILSEGEQKAIALAEFLTELQLDNIKAPVIFDDPVNSLDHIIIDDVARRLLNLSNERQVVIFTHSVLLFNSVLYFSKQPTFKNLVCRLYNSKNEYGQTGLISEAEEEINKVNAYISKINVILNNTPKDRPEAEVAEDGYGYLRSAIELLVEQEIFQGTVKRYQKNIALTQFVKVDGNLINAHKDKLNEIFERCCGFIKGHSNPTEIHNDPTIVELKLDFEDFKKVRDLIPRQ